MRLFEGTTEKKPISRAQVVERAALSAHSYKKRWKRLGGEERLLRNISRSDLRYHCQRSSMSPSIYIIAGPNGRGARRPLRCEFLPNYANCRNFINADLIAPKAWPRFSPEIAAFRAGKLMLAEIDLLAHRRARFWF